MDSKERFDIAVCLIIFRRAEKAKLILDQLAKIRPTRLYLLGDGPRNEEEVEEVNNCRALIESSITWKCDVVKYYAECNRGVYDNIAGGAKWVLEREPYAIFLEDDNFPALSFFSYCKELLLKYKDDSRVLWICGTNYLGEYEPQDGSDYVFTQLMLPCGWATWSHKFAKFYDGDLSLFRDEYVRKRIGYNYNNKPLLRQNIRSWEMENARIMSGKKPVSWDFQMAFTLRAHNLLGIAPKYNQIKNIGTDNFSTHGHNSMENELTKRFCEIEVREMPSPLKHPKICQVDLKFEKMTEAIILQPLPMRIKSIIGPYVVKLFGIPDGVRIRDFFRRILHIQK